MDLQPSISFLLHSKLFLDNKNIQKKQKVIDIQQEQEDREENIKKGLIKEENKEIDNNGKKNENIENLDDN